MSDAKQGLKDEQEKLRGENKQYIEEYYNFEHGHDREEVLSSYYNMTFKTELDFKSASFEHVLVNPAKPGEIITSQYFKLL